MVKTLGYGSGRIQDAKRDEDGMEVMDLDDDEDELGKAFYRKILSARTWKGHVVLANSYRQGQLY